MQLNTFQATLRTRIARLGIKGFIVAQRIKRKPTILRMHDIGGIRTILPSIKELELLKDLYLDKSQKLSHRLVRIDDYIQKPKESSYRGVHLVFSYHTSHP